VKGKTTMTNIIHVAGLFVNCSNQINVITNDSKILALRGDKYNLPAIIEYFNKDKNANNQLVDKGEKVFKISDDDAENLWAIAKDKYESLDKEDKKNESKWEIESEDLPANLRSYYDNKNSENENSDVDDLVNNSNGKAMKDLFRIVVSAIIGRTSGI
jgi:hypothetical protein